MSIKYIITIPRLNFVINHFYQSLTFILDHASNLTLPDLKLQKRHNNYPQAVAIPREGDPNLKKRLSLTSVRSVTKNIAANN